MNNYNDFYIKIENRIFNLDKCIFRIQNSKFRASKSSLMTKLLLKKEEVINKAFNELSVPYYLQEQFRDELFLDEEFNHLMMSVEA